MFNPLPLGSPFIDSSLQVFYDFGDPQSYIPNFGTTVRDLGPYGTTGTLVGGPVWRSDFGGCVQYDGIDDNLTYTGALSASFTTIVAVCPTNASAPATTWTSDDGGFPGYRPAADGFVDATATILQTGLVAIMWAGGSASTVPNSEWFNNNQGFMTFANCSGWTTNGSNAHKRYQNGLLKFTDTATRNRGASAIGTINVGRDPVLSRFPIGRLIAYMHYNRELSADEIAQNHQYFLNRFVTRAQKTL